MPLVQLPALSWKVLIAILTLGMAALVGVEAYNGTRILLNGKVGYTGIDMLGRYGATPDGGSSYTIKIDEPRAGSPAADAKLSLRQGDNIRFARPLDRWRVFHANEAVTLTKVYDTQRDAGKVDALTIEAKHGLLTTMGLVDYWGRLAISVFALSFALLIALRKPVGYAYRCLATMFLMLGSSLFYSFTLAPPGPLATLAKVVQLTVFDLILFCYIGFVLHYQDYASTRLRRWLRAVAPAYQGFALVGAAFTFVFACGYDMPFLSGYTRALLCGGVALALFSLVDGWRYSTGDIRQRHLWLLVALSFGSVPPLLTTVPALQAIGFGTGVRIVTFIAGQLAMYAMLLYATLQYRVFDFGYVTSRLTVKAISSFLLLALFLVLQLLAEDIVDAHLLPGRYPEWWTHVIEAVPAIVVYLVFQLTYEKLKQGLGHLLLRHWEANEKQLHAYVAGASRITEVGNLLASLLAELDRFSEQAGAAVYLRRRDCDFELAGATLAGVPASYGANHELVVALSGDQAPVGNETLADVGIDLALPMCRRGVLLGFVLMGCKGGGAGYRRDEVDALAKAVNQIGLDLRTLYIAELDRKARALEVENVRQRAALLTMLGRRSAHLKHTGTQVAQ